MIIAKQLGTMDIIEKVIIEATLEIFSSMVVYEF
jgi:hypothetical protein